MIPNVCSIAGTDPSGGAGIQADLKAFSALGGYGMAVVTAVVAQTTTGVSGSVEIPAGFVAQQIDTLFADVRVDAVKIGMLANREVVAAVADALERWRPPVVVLDPVMVAKSGDRLLADDAVEELRLRLFPRVDLITPNLPEAAALLGGEEAGDVSAMIEQARSLRALGAPWVLLKGGHLGGDTSTDVLIGPSGEIEVMPSPRISTSNDHGTGCTLSSAIAVLRPQLGDWVAAVRQAKEYLTAALAAADRLEVGHGRGPVHHFFALWGQEGC